MEVFLMIRRKKTAFLLDATEQTTVEEVKKIVAGITKVPPENLQLHKDDRVMDPSKVLREYGLTSSSAMAHAPAVIGLTYKDATTGEFEVLEIEPFSLPPVLSDLPVPLFTYERMIPTDIKIHTKKI